jgi:hypothetical protein
MFQPYRSVMSRHPSSNPPPPSRRDLTEPGDDMRLDGVDRMVIGPFGLDHVLASDLPDSLGTVGAPDHYVVTAIFSRRPDPLELELLGEAGVHEELVAAGYPRVTLTAADRRLLIGDTNLHELESGLARTIAVILATIGERVAERRAVRDGERDELRQREADRASIVATAAARISFNPRTSHYS